MSSIGTNSEDLVLNADGSSSEIKLKIDGTEKASISSAGAFTSTTIDATKLTGALPAISGANLTGVGVDGITSSANATAITINSSEQVGIGTGSPTSNSKVHIYNGASGQSASSNNTELVIENDNNTGIQFLTPNNKISGIWFGDPENKEIGRIYYSHSDNSFNVVTDSTQRVRIDGNGLLFGSDTAAANALDDYEEGLFTCTCVGQTSGSTGISSGTDQLAYIKIGKLVHVSGYVTGDGSSNLVGNLLFSLPFTAATLAEHADRIEAGGVRMRGYGSSIANEQNIWLGGGSTTFGMSYLLDNGTSGNFDNLVVTNDNFNIGFNFVYRAA